MPLRDLVNKFAHVRFEPAGFTGNPEIPIAKSIVDYVFRWMGSRFLPADEKAQIGLIDRGAVVESAPVSFGAVSLASAPESDAPVVADESDEGDTGRPKAVGLAVALEAAPGLDEPAGRRVGGPLRHRQWPLERQRQRPCRRRQRFAGLDQGRVQGPGGLAVLRRMRLDHGSQRELLQVPQLRLDLGLQLSLARAKRER